MGNKTATTKTVDFIPEYGISGDFKKVTEYDFLKYNALIQPVIALLNMEKGSNTVIPDMGCKDTLLKFPFCEEDNIEQLVNELNSNLNKWSDVECTAKVDVSKSNWTTGDITLSIDIYSIPAPLKLSVNKNSASAQQIKIVPPSIFS